MLALRRGEQQAGQGGFIVKGGSGHSPLVLTRLGALCKTSETEEADGFRQRKDS